MQSQRAETLQEHPSRWTKVRRNPPLKSFKGSSMGTVVGPGKRLFEACLGLGGLGLGLEPKPRPSNPLKPEELGLTRGVLPEVCGRSTQGADEATQPPSRWASEY